jgi:hypothetical protein
MPHISREKLTLCIAVLRTSSFGVCLLAATVTTDMGGSRLAECSTVSALRYGTTLCKAREHGTKEEKGVAYLFIDVLQRPIRVLAVANTMSPHTCLTGILFALDQHLDLT